VQQIEFVGGTCGSIDVESFNRNKKALRVLESKWNPIRKKLVRRLLEEQDNVLRSYFAQKGGTRIKGGAGTTIRAGNMSNGTCMCLRSIFALSIAELRQDHTIVA
jgi:hypothetical protein